MPRPTNSLREGTGIERVPLAEVEVIPRKEFVKEFGRDYGPGQHVTFLGPKQRGKTTLAIDLLHECISPELRCIILAGKPPNRDQTMADAAKKLNLRVVETWPPMYSPRDRKRNGYVLRPHQTLKDLDADNANLQRQFRAALMSAYASQKPVIIVCDEAHHVQNDMKLKKEYEASLMRGAPVVAEWSLIQRGAYMSYHAYSEADHLFIFYDPDAKNRKRYSDFGSLDPRATEAIIENLRLDKAANGMTISECLYIHRSDPIPIIVGMK